MNWMLLMLLMLLNSLGGVFECVEFVELEFVDVVEFVGPNSTKFNKLHQITLFYTKLQHSMLNLL